jgi:hypothetical protein
MKLNLLIIIIFIICIYHYLIQNRIEKIFFKRYLNKDFEELIKRPLKKCIQKNTNKCMGMPSAHSETITIFGFLLYFYKIIPLWICLFLICIFSFQRVASNMHSIVQVFVGILLGFFYALLYKQMNLSFYSFCIVLYIGLILYIFILSSYLY